MTSGFDGFEKVTIDVDGVGLSVHVRGEGAPLVLLHGYPQNHLAWTRVAPEFARHFRVVVPDLRGYGDSDAPPDDISHTVYSKRRMAMDVVALMAGLRHDRFSVLGHDRGARVAYRLALDHPDKVEKIGIVEVVPTGDMWANWTAEMALSAYHWTFLAQPAPMPERLISGDPVAYLDHTLRTWTRGGALDVFTPAALDSFRAQMADPVRVAAMCADYRAGATTDRALDEADRQAGRKIAAPLMFLCGENGFPARTGKPADLWKGWAREVTATTCTSGHFVMDENPSAVIEAFVPFFR